MSEIKGGTMEIIGRKEAIEKGLKRYFTGKPCKHGHVSERNIEGSCLQCNIDFKKERYVKARLKAKADRERYKEERELMLCRIEEFRKQAECDYREYKRKMAPAVFIRNTLQRIENSVGKGCISRNEMRLGYTREDFRVHIESQFKKGMSWSNRSKWHIDHIKPLSLFIKKGITDPKIINALDNLQPLWAKDNLSKGAKDEE